MVLHKVSARRDRTSDLVAYCIAIRLTNCFSSPC